MKRLVISGMGAVTPIGIGVESYWENLLAYKSGIDYIESIDTDELPVKFAGEVKDFRATDFMPRKLSSEMDRFMQMAFAAASEAIADCGGVDDSYRTGVVIGSALNGIKTITETERNYQSSLFKRVGPRFLPKSLGNVCASQIAIANEIHGPSMTVNTACASGGDAISLAAMMINSGMADMMVVAGGEAAIEPIMIQSLAAAQALSTRNDEPANASRPFDIGRDGFVMGEGGGALVLESEEHARARSARIHAYLAGFGNNTDAYHPVTPRPDGEGEILCMRQAIELAGIEPHEISYINTHGTSTVKGDICENEAIKRVFGCDSTLLLNSTKGATGHMMGAGGITEVISCIKALQTGIVPATLNLENKDPKCDLNYLSVNAETQDMKYAMSNAFGFGGQNSSIIVGKC